MIETRKLGGLAVSDLCLGTMTFGRDTPPEEAMAQMDRALDAGQVGRAVLDVFNVEPLPPDHPYWCHPRVVVLPHIAAETDPQTAVSQVAENLRRLKAGEPLRNVVDRAAGY